MIVCCCSTLLVLNLLLLGYFLFHVFLIVTNQTTYERYCRGEYNAGEPSTRTFYNLGVRRNIEEFLSGCYLPPRGTSSQYKLSPRIFNEKHA
ncbi:unnamed protein product [Dibothriocephalus latus]|uniref:Palmitoyltransferase n=1 Tax=Dibothriocephalus latus TaxID=60516 RepID=A0A3P7NZ72_DIBLA|nr:unnamed protein product [Dibothriocephalus latus]